MASTKDENNFRDYPIQKAVATMAIPTVIGQLIVLIYNLADTIYVYGVPHFVLSSGDIMTDIVSLSWFYSIIKKYEEAIKKGESL